MNRNNMLRVSQNRDTNSVLSQSLGAYGGQRLLAQRVAGTPVAPEHVSCVAGAHATCRRHHPGQDVPPPEKTIRAEMRAAHDRHQDQLAQAVVQAAADSELAQQRKAIRDCYQLPPHLELTPAFVMHFGEPHRLAMFARLLRAAWGGSN